MAATTLALTGARQPRTGVKVASSGAGTIALGTVTMSSSYDTGGSAADFGTGFGLIGIRGSSTTKEPTMVFLQPSAGYVPEWVASSKKVKVYRQSAASSALTEVPSTTDLSAVTFNALLFF
jgi:hypothetical protein